MNTNIYIDVDGVINAFGPNSRRKTLTGWHGEWSTKKINSFPITWSHELIVKLHDLSKTKGVTIKWLTTWTNEAPEILCPGINLDGKNWPVVGDGPQYSDKHGWWKLAAIRDDIKASRPEKAIWIDDDLRMEREAMWWICENRNVLAISPEPSLGITSHEIKRIFSYIKEAP